MIRDAALHWGETALRRSLSFLDPATGLIELPGPPSKWGARSDGLEGIGRTLLLWSYLGAGGGFVTDDQRRALGRALEAGARGGWPRPGASRQSLVDAASIALAMRISDDSLLEDLSDRSRRRFFGWLRGIRETRPSTNNWVLFPRVISEYLIEAGEDDGRGVELIREADRRVEEWYRGDGRYTDGAGRVHDYYNAWAFHYYLPLSAHLSGDERAVARHRARLDPYVDDLLLMIDRDGGPVLHGRSLTYRFGMAAPLALRALLGSPEAEAHAERLGSAWRRCFSFFDAERRGDGALLPGWRREFPGIAQRYSGPASSLWAFKAYAALLLPPDHPFWREDRPLPGTHPEDGVRVSSIGVVTARTNGVSVLVNHGIDHQRRSDSAYFRDDPGYAHLGYSSVTPPGSGSLAFSVVDGRGVASQRGIVRALATGSDWASSSHRPVRLRRGFGHPLLDRGRLDSIGPRVRPIAPEARIDEATLAMGDVFVHVFRAVGLRGLTAVLRGWALAGEEGGLGVQRGSGLESSTTLPGVHAGLRGIAGFTRMRRSAGGAPSPLGITTARPELSGPIDDDVAVFVAESWLGRGAGPAADRVEVRIETDPERVVITRGERRRELPFAELWPGPGEGAAP